jgi:hypothetical protein
MALCPVSEGKDMRVSVLLSVGLAVLIGVSGCGGETREGPQTVKVTGTVTLDGDPVEGAHVSFRPRTQGPPAFAVTDKRGRYQLMTFDPGDGAIAGKYDIFVEKEVTTGGMEFESQAALEAYIEKEGKRPPKSKTVNELPKKYADRRTPLLEAEVNMAKRNHFELELTSK